MFGEKFQRKYALTDQGVRNTKKGTYIMRLKLHVLVWQNGFASCRWDILGNVIWQT